MGRINKFSTGEQKKYKRLAVSSLTASRKFMTLVAGLISAPPSPLPSPYPLEIQKGVAY